MFWTLFEKFKKRLAGFVIRAFHHIYTRKIQVTLIEAGGHPDAFFETRNRCPGDSCGGKERQDCSALRDIQDEFLMPFADIRKRARVHQVEQRPYPSCNSLREPNGGEDRLLT